MSLSIALFVVLGAAVGAPMRYLLERSITRRMKEPRIPWGLVVVNVLGSFVIGLAAVTTSQWVLALVVTGFCGALTTFSGFGWEVSSQIAAGARSTWMSTVAIMVVGTLLAFCAGYGLALLLR